MKSLSKLFSSNKIRLSLGIIISLGALYLAIRGVDIRFVWQTILNARLEFVLLAVICIALTTLAKTFRWKLLVGPKGKYISTINYMMILLAGQLLNAVFPARLGDLSRAYVLGGKGPGRTFVLGTIVLEKILDSIAYIILFGSIIFLIPLPDWVGGSIFALILVTFIIVLGILLVVFLPTPFIKFLNRLLNRLPEHWRSWLSPRIESGLTSLEIIRRRDDLVRLVIWTTMIWILAVITNHFVLLALDIYLPIAASMLILFGLQAGISLPAIPGTIGLFEYICILALSVFSIDQSLSLSYGFLLHAIVMVPTTLAGLLSFWLLGLFGQRKKIQDGMA